MNGKNPLFIFVFLLCAFALSAQSGDLPRIYGDSSRTIKVLLLYQPTEYKEKLVNYIEDNLKNNKSLYLVVDDLKAGKRYIPEDFSAVVIVNTGKAGNPDGKAKKLAAQTGGSVPLFILTTYASRGKGDIEGADTLTAASEEAEIPDTAQTLLNWLEDQIFRK